MDWLTFIAELTKALAWPLSVLVIVILLRKPFSDLIPLLQRLKYKDLEIEFRKQVQEVRAEVNEELPSAHPSSALASQVIDSLKELARVSPRNAVIETWQKVEAAALEAAHKNNVSLPFGEVASPLRVIRDLERAHVVDPSKMAIFHDLRALRNQAAHAPEFALSTQAAIEYAELGWRLTEYLRSARRAPET